MELSKNRKFDPSPIVPGQGAFVPDLVFLIFFSILLIVLLYASYYCLRIKENRNVYNVMVVVFITLTIMVRIAGLIYNMTCDFSYND
jgi:hypothetical protein